MVPEKNGPRKNDPRKMVPGKLVPAKMNPEKMVPRKLDPGKLRNEKSWGVHRGMCVECWDVINLCKPKTRQQIFLDSFSVLKFGAYVGS